MNIFPSHLNLIKINLLFAHLAVKLHYSNVYKYFFSPIMYDTYLKAYHSKHRFNTFCTVQYIYVGDLPPVYSAHINTAAVPNPNMYNCTCCRLRCLTLGTDVSIIVFVKVWSVLKNSFYF